MPRPPSLILRAHSHHALTHTKRKLHQQCNCSCIQDHSWTASTGTQTSGGSKRFQIFEKLLLFKLPHNKTWAPSDSLIAAGDGGHRLHPVRMHWQSTLLQACVQVPSPDTFGQKRVKCKLCTLRNQLVKGGTITSYCETSSYKCDTKNINLNTMRQINVRTKLQFKQPDFGSNNTSPP